MADQTHCPDCGVSKLALTVIKHTPDGSWVCGPCDATRTRRATPPPAPAGTPSQFATVTCPDHLAGRDCTTCGGFGVVRVPVDSLKVYSPPVAAPKLLTEVAPEG